MGLERPGAGGAAGVVVIGRAPLRGRRLMPRGPPQRLLHGGRGLVHLAGNIGRDLVRQHVDGPDQPALRRRRRRSRPTRCNASPVRCRWHRPAAAAPRRNRPAFPARRCRWRTSRSAHRRRGAISTTKPGASFCAAPKSRTTAQTDIAGGVDRDVPVKGGHGYGLLREVGARNDCGWSRASPADRLDIIAVGIDQERRVVGRAVIRPRPGAPLSLPPAFSPSA